MAQTAELTVSDNSDGTGAIAVVSNSVATAINTLYTQRVNGELGTDVWTEQGSVVGNAPIAVSIQAGFYWWKIVTVDGTERDVSNLVYQQVSDGIDALHNRILDASVAQIESLALDGIKQVVRTDVENQQRLTFPCIAVTPFGMAETILGGTLNRDDLGYPVFVALLARNPRSSRVTRRAIRHRQSIRRTLGNQELPGVPEVGTCDVEPSVILEIAVAKQYQVITSAILFRYKTREVRGFGA